MVVRAEAERPISQHLHVRVRGQDCAQKRRRVPPTDSLCKVKLTRFDGARGRRGSGPPRRQSDLAEEKTPWGSWAFLNSSV